MPFVIRLLDFGRENSDDIHPSGFADVLTSASDYPGVIRMISDYVVMLLLIRTSF